MSFPEIKRANKECMLGSSWKQEFYYPKHIEEERLSRAKWAKAMTRKLHNSFLISFVKPKVMRETVEDVITELLRQARLDESSESVVAEADEK